jgi:FtsP/CotA-like multicopper oxidase with cupredoxin domain
MNATFNKKLSGWNKVLVLTLLLALFVSVTGTRPAPAVKAAGLPDSLMQCTSDTTTNPNPNPSFTLTTRTGYISLPDGNTTYMWSFSSGSKDFQYPGPILCVNQGDNVTIVLHNTLPQEVSILFPGQDNVLADGAPAQPVGNSLVKPAAVNGAVTYTFTAAKPGTFVYESGTNTALQIQMGLFGALVVRPTGHSDWAYGTADTQFNPEAEFINILSEVDTTLHTAVELNQPFDLRNFTPRYWLINGRGFPDTVGPNYASWLPTQPYSSLVHIKEYNAASNNLPALVRYLSVGSEIYHFHPHGFNGRLIARDGNPLKGSSGQDISFEKFSIPLGPGQTWDSLIKWNNADAFSPTANPVPVTVPPDTDITIGQFFSGSPYLGSTEVLPPGTVVTNQCGEYYHIAHNHDLYKITSWGISMTGQITYTRVDPLAGCP